MGFESVDDVAAGKDDDDDDEDEDDEDDDEDEREVTDCCDHDE